MGVTPLTPWWILPCPLLNIWLPHQVPCRPLNNPHHLWLRWTSSFQPWPIWQWPSPHTSMAISTPRSILPECISLPRLGHLPLGTASTPTPLPKLLVHPLPNSSSPTIQHPPIDYSTQPFLGVGVQQQPPQLSSEGVTFQVYNWTSSLTDWPNSSIYRHKYSSGRQTGTCSSFWFCLGWLSHSFAKQRLELVQFRAYLLGLVYWNFLFGYFNDRKNLEHFRFLLARPPLLLILNSRSNSLKKGSPMQCIYISVMRYLY